MNVDIKEVLFPNILTILVQLCSTGVLFFVAKKFLWKPVQEMLDKRAELAQSKLIESQKREEDLDYLLNDAKAKVVEAKRVADGIFEQAVKDAEVIKQDAIENANEIVNNRLQKLQEDLEFGKQKLKEQMYNEMVEISLDVAAKLMSEKIDEEQDRKVVEEFIKEIKNDE